MSELEGGFLLPWEIAARGEFFPFGDPCQGVGEFSGAFEEFDETLDVDAFAAGGGFDEPFHGSGGSGEVTALGLETDEDGDGEFRGGGFDFLESGFGALGVAGAVEEFGEEAFVLR